MKTLKGMERNFSSLENKKLKRDDLKAVQGANTFETSENATCYDKKTINGAGVKVSTLYVGDNCQGL